MNEDVKAKRAEGDGEQLRRGKKEAGREGSVEKGGILEQEKKKRGCSEKVMLRRLRPPPRLGSFLRSYSTAHSSATPSFPPWLYPSAPLSLLYGISRKCRKWHHTKHFLYLIFSSFLLQLSETFASTVYLLEIRYS